MNETQYLECELLVAGGGLAGVCCALAAARLGVRVIICQDRPVLGGNASSEIRMHIVGATGLRGGVALESELREGGIIEEMRLEMAVQNPQRSPSMMDLMLFDKCRQEPNITLLLNTSIEAAQLADGSIRSVTALRSSTEDRFEIRADLFADCTGDGRLGVEAGAPYRHGREGRETFGESLAPAVADKYTLGSTLLFQAKKHEQAMPYVAPAWVRRFTAEDFRHRPFGKPGFDLGLEYGYWWAEWGGCLDTVKDNELIRDELLAIILGVWNYIKNESGLPVDNWALDWFGFIPGKRESRRFVGLHTLSEGDVVSSRKFEDAIAYGGWPIDMHPPEGMDAPQLPPCEQHHIPYVYDVPLRACVSAGPRNLFFAGRNISATHVAFASTRVMATCAAVGQGVGTAAAVALRNGLDAVALTQRPELLAQVRQRLLRDDAYLIGTVNEDAGDLVRSATSITASSAQAGADAGQIRSAQTRSLHGAASATGEADAGHGLSETHRIPVAPPGRCPLGLHRWMSDPAEGMPAWLQIDWAEPVSIAELSLVFDTGLHRILALSQADGYTAKMQWGRPQQETVRDYHVEFKINGQWQQLVTVGGNYQRLRRHRLERTVCATAVRITVTGTQGIDHARICEVRAYADSESFPLLTDDKR